MDHFPKDHARTQRDERVGNGVVADEIPGGFFGDDFRGAVCGGLASLAAL
jgi:hypothetical protein